MNFAILVVVFVIMWVTGFLRKIIECGVLVLVLGLILGVAFWIFGGVFSNGWHIGLWVGLILYALDCIGEIISDDVILEAFSDGHIEERHSPRVEGIVGLLASIAMVFIII